jgi:hypothetical protein
VGPPAGDAIEECEIVQRGGDIGPVSAWIALGELAEGRERLCVGRLGVGQPAGVAVEECEIVQRLSDIGPVSAWRYAAVPVTIVRARAYN